MASMTTSGYSCVVSSQAAEEGHVAFRAPSPFARERPSPGSGFLASLGMIAEGSGC